MTSRYALKTACTLCNENKRIVFQAEMTRWICGKTVLDWHPSSFVLADETRPPGEYLEYLEVLHTSPATLATLGVYQSTKLLTSEEGS